MDDSKIISKLRKLLAMAERTDGNENEAEVAAAMAEKLIRQYAIDRSQLDAAAPDANPLAMREFFIDSATWKGTLAWRLAMHCSVSALRGKRWCRERQQNRTYMVAYGRRASLELWEYLYHICHKQIHDACAAWVKKCKRGTAPSWAVSNGWNPSKSRRTDFRESAVSGLYDTLLAQKRAARVKDETGTALVRADAEEAREYMLSKTAVGKARRSQRASSHCSAGYKAGTKIRLNRGIGQRSHRRIK